MNDGGIKRMAVFDDLIDFEPRLTSRTAALAQGFGGACSFVNHLVDGEALAALHAGGQEEASVFFRDLSARVLQDDVLARLLTFPNVLITSHQGCLTHEALGNSAETTLGSAHAFERGESLKHAVSA